MAEVGATKLVVGKDSTKDVSEDSAVVNPKEAVRSINTLITGLELYKKDDAELTTREVDSIILGIGKLRGAINKLNRED